MDDNISQSTPIINPIPNSAVSAISSQNTVSSSMNEKPSQSEVTVTSSQVKTKNKLPLIIFSVLILIILIGVLFYFKQNLGKNISLNKIIPITTSPLSKYDTDTDGDFIPDYIETKAGLNPAVSEIERCKLTDCSPSQIQTAQKVQKNVLIILDASGSMAELIDGQSKMDAAKAAIIQYVNSAAGKINIGLMVYGHKGSNSDADKNLSCSSIDTLAEIGSLTTQNAGELLSAVKPTGWTAIGSALLKAQQLFTGKEDQINQVIVVSDGIETCDSDPVTTATQLNASGLKINIDVIGFAVNTAGQNALKNISDNGGGIYSSANTSDELNQQLKTKEENISNLREESICKISADSEVFICFADVLKKADDVIFGITETNSNSTITSEEFNFLISLSDKIHSKYKEIRDNMSTNTDKSLQDKQNILDQQ